MSEPIAYLHPTKLPEHGYRLVCPGCRAPEVDECPVFRENVSPYNVTCARCGDTISPGLKRLRDGADLIYNGEE